MGNTLQEVDSVLEALLSVEQSLEPALEPFAPWLPIFRKVVMGVDTVAKDLGAVGGMPAAMQIVDSHLTPGMPNAPQLS